MIMSPLCYR